MTVAHIENVERDVIEYTYISGPYASILHDDGTSGVYDNRSGRLINTYAPELAYVSIMHASTLNGAARLKDHGEIGVGDW